MIDVLRTYNSAGELTQIRYVAEHELTGCKVIDRDVLETTIRMGSPIVPIAPVVSQEPAQSPIESRVDELLSETECAYCGDDFDEADLCEDCRGRFTS